MQVGDRVRNLRAGPDDVHVHGVGTVLWAGDFTAEVEWPSGRTTLTRVDDLAVVAVAPIGYSDT